MRLLLNQYLPAPGTVSSVVTVPASGPWPTRVFAPYCDILLWPTLNITQVAQQTGVKYYTLAFLISDAAGNPAWGGMTPLEQGFYGEYINGIRKLGGDVIISFGGLNGKKPFLYCAIALKMRWKLRMPYAIQAKKSQAPTLMSKSFKPNMKPSSKNTTSQHLITTLKAMD